MFNILTFTVVHVVLSLFARYRKQLVGPGAGGGGGGMR